MIIINKSCFLIIIIEIFGTLSLEPIHKVTYQLDWKIVEALAEQHPYIVGLVNATLDYLCTGIIISRITVLTSGSCIDPSLHYIVVGSSVLSKDINNSSLFRIASTKLHDDYIFEMIGPESYRDPNVTRIHSNIGLVFSKYPNLQVYFPGADLGDYFASELQQKNFKVVGFGRINATNLVVLQQQSYHQSPCTNPKWYYCVCGFEYSVYSKTYEHEFGKGAPVLLGSEVVGITAAPCGSLELKSTALKYNIFTVIGPYVPWINKNIAEDTKVNFRSTDRAEKLSFRKTYILLMMVKVLFN